MDYVMGYEVIAEPKKRCTGSGWPIGGNNQCLGCDKVNPKMTRRYLVAAHPMTVLRYCKMHNKAGKNG